MPSPPLRARTGMAPRMRRKERRSNADASRIFGALISMRKIGDKQLSELCMMKHSKVKKVLYRMLSDKFVEMEYIPRSSDRDPKKSFFVWTINSRSIHKKLLHSMYNAVFANR